MRIEKDYIGEVEIEDDKLYGIHSLRAKNNFPNEIPFPVEWYKTVAMVKACYYLTYQKFSKSIKEKYDKNKLPFKLIDEEIISALLESALKASTGKYIEYLIVPGISGGAGTSINMNINEILANSALIKIGKKPGEYQFISPIEHANIYQSTNDVIPSSLKLTLMQLFTELENHINNLRNETEKLENKYRDVLRIAYTQMQEAVPSSYGKLFSAYCDAFSRDWWRISKCNERIKVVNLGGSAIGTGITVPKYFIMNVTQELQKLSGMPVTRSENLHDATSNLDSFVEVSAILKSHAVNLEKISSDLRLLASDININQDFEIPQMQVGSSIMPGKINPVIVEYVVSCCHQVYANDALITTLCALGCLDLNAYIPLIGIKLIENIKLLISSDISLKNNLLNGIKIDKNKANDRVLKSSSIATALLPYIGYNNSSLLAKEMKLKCIDIITANNELKLIDNDKLIEILKTDDLLKTGFSINDIMD
jgi:aspartate ammonia-lyase